MVANMMLQALILATVISLQGGAQKPAIPAHPVSKEPAAGTIKKSLKGDVDMVYVPSGEFTMGSIYLVEEKPMRKVFLDGFWIGKNVVTVAQFRAYCSDAIYEFQWDEYKPEWGWIDNYPMVNVTWDEAAAYCKWAGGDLPTEAQWEKAARGDKGLLFPWGMQFKADLLQSSVEGAQSGPAAVGTFPLGASPYGCLDMAGNVFQWVADWHSDDGYTDLPTKNPAGVPYGDYRVLRGGSWNSVEAGMVRTSHRGYKDPGTRSPEFGFRVAATKVSP